MSMGGGKGGGKSSTAESRQLGAMGSRFEQEARGSRGGAINNLTGILDFGADWLGPSMGGPSNYPGSKFSTASDPANYKYSKGEILEAYNRNDPGKGQDLERILKGLPGDSFSLDELRGLSTEGLSARSGAAWNSSLGDLESLAKSGGGSMGGMSGGPGGYGAALLPIAQQSVEQSLKATSDAVRGLTAGSAYVPVQGGGGGSSRGGGASNPYFQQQIARTRMAGDQATSQVPSQLVERFLMGALPMVFGQSAIAAGAGGNAAGVGAGLYGSGLGAQATLNQGAGAGLSALGEGIARGYMYNQNNTARPMGGVTSGGSSTAGGSWGTST